MFAGTDREGLGTKPVNVYVDEIDVLCGVVCGAEGPAEVVVLTVGMGYGLLS